MLFASVLLAIKTLSISLFEDVKLTLERVAVAIVVVAVVAAVAAVVAVVVAVAAVAVAFAIAAVVCTVAFALFRKSNEQKNGTIAML